MTAASYQEPSLESFCDSLIREQDKLIHLGIFNNADISGKTLLSQQKEKSKPPKKQNFRNNKPNKGPKPSQSTPYLKNDKGSKPKGKKTKCHCNFCGKDNHDESKCFNNMAALKVAMKKEPHQPRFIFRIYLSWTCTLCFWLFLYCIFFFYSRWMAHWFWSILLYG